MKHSNIFSNIHCCVDGENHFIKAVDTVCEFSLLACGCPDVWVQADENDDRNAFGNLGEYLASVLDIDERTDDERQTLDLTTVVNETPEELLTDSDKFIAAHYNIGEHVPYPRRLLPHTEYRVRIDFVVAAMNTGNPHFSRPRTFCPDCWQGIEDADNEDLGAMDEDGWSPPASYTLLSSLSVEYTDETVSDGLLYLQVEHRPAHCLNMEWGIEEAIAFTHQRHTVPWGNFTAQEEFYCDRCSCFVMHVSDVYQL